MSPHLIPTASVQRDSRGVKPDKPEVIKVRKRCRRFWERYVLERRSSHPTKPRASRTETGGIAGGKEKHHPMWHLGGTGVVKKGSNTTQEPEKTKREEVLWFWQGFNFLF